MVRSALAFISAISFIGARGVVKASPENVGNWQNESSQIEILICKAMQGTNESSVVHRACDGLSSLGKNVCKSGVDKIWHMMKERCDSNPQQQKLTSSVNDLMCKTLENEDYEEKGKDLMCAQVPASMQDGCEQVVGKLWDMALSKWCPSAPGNRTLVSTTSVPLFKVSLASSRNSSRVEAWVCKMMQGTNESSVVNGICDNLSSSQKDLCKSGVDKVWHLIEDRCDSKLQQQKMTGSVNDFACNIMQNKDYEEKGKDVMCAKVPEPMQDGCEKVVGKLWDMAVSKWCSAAATTTLPGVTTTAAGSVDTTSAANTMTTVRNLTTTYSTSAAPLVPTSLPMTTAPLGNLTTVPLANATTSFPFVPTSEPMINTTSFNLVVV